MRPIKQKFVPLSERNPPAQSKKIDEFFAREQESVTTISSDTIPEETEIDSYGEQRFAYGHAESPYLRRNPNAALIAWQGPEYEVYKKSKTWHTVIGLILAMIVLQAIFTNNPVTAITFVVIGLVGYLYLNKPPRVMDFGITHEGIIAGEHLFHFDDIKSFWIFYNPPHTRVISLHMHGRLLPYIHIPLHQIDPVDMHEILIQFVEEEEQEHNLIDTLERILRI